MANPSFSKVLQPLEESNETSNSAALESFVLEPDNESVMPWKHSFPTPYYGCFYALSPKLADLLPCRERIHEMSSPNLLAGASSIHRRAGWVVKVLAGDPYSYKRAIEGDQETTPCGHGRAPTDF